MRSKQVLPCYDQDGITIYHGDCFKLLHDIPVCDHVITDPPYDEKTHKGARYGFRETSSEIAFKPLEDAEELAHILLDKADRWVLAFCSLEMFGQYAAGAGDCWIRSGLWVRPNGVPQFSGDRPGQAAEGIAIMHSGRVRRWNNHGMPGLWAFNIVQGRRLHQTEKPIKLMRKLILDFTDEGDTILDPFMGSGTTLRACKDLGRYAIGIEKVEKYCEIAAKRMQEKTPLEKTTTKGTVADEVRKSLGLSNPAKLKGV